MWEVAKYKGRWALFDTKSRCFVLFGPKRRMEARARELNGGCA